jgi:putative redox protein
MSTETNSQPKISVRWLEAIKFEAEVPSGHRLTFDSTSENHPVAEAPSPLEAFLASAAACSAMDVISILVKKRQVVTAYHVEASYDRKTEGDWPHPIIGITMNHVLSGEKLDEEAVRHAVELSDAKYCTVIATLRFSPEVTSLFTIKG